MTKVHYKLLFLIIAITVVAFSLSACTEEEIKLVWQDSDGTVIKATYQPKSQASPNLCSLPEDTDEWHYVGWKEISTSFGFIYISERLPVTSYAWWDAQGNLISEARVVDGEDVPVVALPEDDGKWKYTEWTLESNSNKRIYTAKRVPNTDYFVGNVFQIITEDENGNPVGAGSGFILNKDGWFITNNHVMEGADKASAFFDIKDSESGNQYTRLKVIGGAYCNSQKDIFIGKLDGYCEIEEYYKNIPFTTEYSSGENSYTVGYPNSSVKMEINSGKILEEYSDIYDKINGVYYILSDSYIAPGSSGGILVNEELEVVGITTIGLYSDESQQIYEAGGSIPTFVFSPHILYLEDNQLKPLNEIYQSNGGQL